MQWKVWCACQCDLSLDQTALAILAVANIAPERGNIMSTNTTAFGFNAAVDTTAASAKPGFLRRVFDRIIEVRKAHGEAHVRAYLSGLSDQRLADLGFSADRIKAVRAKDGAVNSYWL
ncbi:MAG: hypothetical protein ACKVP3_14520 [Hyphomicrobiaceae bacterium]